MAQLQSSYLPPGLSPEDYARAMAAAQPAQPPVALPVQDEPAAASPVSAASPEPAADQPDAAEQPPVAPVEMATGAPKQNIDTYRQQTLDAQNAQIANAPGLGDEHGLHGEDYRKMAAISEASAAKSAGVTKAARADVDESRKRQEVMRSKADALFSEMERNKQPPPDSVMSKVLAAIGTVIAIGGNKPAAAQGVAMLAGSIGQDRERWAQEQAANSHLYQLALKGAESGSADDLNRLDAAAKVLALEGHEKLDALESAKNMGMGEHADAVATDMQLGLRAKITDSLTKIEEEKQALLEQRARAAGRTALENKYYRMDLADLLAMRGEGLDKVGHEVLAKRIATEQGENAKKSAEDKTAAEIAKAEAEAAKLRGEAGGGKKLTEGERKMDIQVAGASEAFHRLVPYAFDDKGEAKNYKEGGIPGAGIAPGTQWIPDQMLPEDNVQYRTDVLANLAAVLRAESGANIPDHEVALKAKAFGLFSSDQAVRQRALQSLLKQTKSMDITNRLGDLREKPKKQIMFSEDGAGPNGAAGDAARAYLESRDGLGSSGT